MKTFKYTTRIAIFALFFMMVANVFNLSELYISIKEETIQTAENCLRRADFMEERINYPADPDNKWKYRMHLGVDALMADHSFCEKLRQLIKSSNR